MAPQEGSVDEIIGHYEEPHLGNSNVWDSDGKRGIYVDDAEFTTETTADEPMPKTSMSNAHANGHKDEVEGYMCHECVLEAAIKTWQGSGEEAELVREDSNAISGSVLERYPSAGTRVLSPATHQKSKLGVDASINPTSNLNSRFSIDSAVPHIINIGSRSSNDSSLLQHPTKNTEDVLLQGVTVSEKSPLLSPTSENSSMFTPQLAHKSLMDNPFEQRINIRTIDQYQIGLKKFWTITAVLLGPDFDYRYDDVVERMSDRPGESDMPLGARSSVSWPISPTVKIGSTARNMLSKELCPALESMGMAWRWFDSESAVQKYINVRITPGAAWDFGYCFERTDGSQHCMVMHVIGGAPHEQKKTYEDVVEEPKIPERFNGAGVSPRFWWCRSHPESKDRDPKRKARDLRLKQRYEEAKKNVEIFKKSDAVEHKFAVESSYGKLYLDLEIREQVFGHYSIATLNTILQLAEITEALGNLTEAEDWNQDLVKRRIKRMGPTSEHTCYARFKLCQLLIKVSKWEEAKMISTENVTAVADYQKSHILYTRQNILACMIAMKRRRIDTALTVVPYLNLLTIHHPEDLIHREMALEVAIAAYTFKRQYDSAVIFLRKIIALYASGYGNQHKQLTYQFDLAFALHRLQNRPAAIQTLKESIHLAKSLSMDLKSEQLLDIYLLLGQILFESKEWNPAKFYLESAAHGYREVLGKESEKYVKAKSLYLRLEEAAKIKLGLAERLARHHLKQVSEARPKAVDKGMGGNVLEKRRSMSMRLMDLIPGAPVGNKAAAA